MLEKCMLVVRGVEAKEACGTDQLYGGREAGTEEGIHMVRLLWQQNAHDEDWGFLLIDSRNVFNEENRTSMLWEMGHEWTSGA